MHTLFLLIAVNFLVVPFLQEAEARGRQLRHFPTLPSILRLAHVRRSAGLPPFAVFALIFLAAAVANAQGRRIEVFTLVIHFAIIQAVLWSVVVLSVRKPACLPSAAAVPGDDEDGGQVVAPLLRRL